ncbi:hypothetical protein EX30DRAFT_398113 [Ascodesmis nigricans]|uniref:Uncharacterized protein n=1 Tax=Ascodesmis nigricans TaxID=341454 RepID=A0A4S2MR27_9PEZI|nr:hypothetical protein EX30DRAFT_398113 [Ascodesmis nigricans]
MTAVRGSVAPPLEVGVVKQGIGGSLYGKSIKLAMSKESTTLLPDPFHLTTIRQQCLHRRDLRDPPNGTFTPLGISPAPQQPTSSSLPTSRAPLNGAVQPVVTVTRGLETIELIRDNNGLLELTGTIEWTNTYRETDNGGLPILTATITVRSSSTPTSGGGTPRPTVTADTKTAAVTRPTNAVPPPEETSSTTEPGETDAVSSSSLTTSSSAPSGDLGIIPSPTATISPSPSHTSPPVLKSKSATKNRIILGGSIGAGLGIFLIVCIIIWCKHRKKRQQQRDDGAKMEISRPMIVTEPMVRRFSTLVEETHAGGRREEEPKMRGALGALSADMGKELGSESVEMKTWTRAPSAPPPMQNNVHGGNNNPPDDSGPRAGAAGPRWRIPKTPPNRDTRWPSLHGSIDLTDYRFTQRRGSGTRTQPAPVQTAPQPVELGEPTPTSIVAVQSQSQQPPTTPTCPLSSATDILDTYHATPEERIHSTFSSPITMGSALEHVYSPSMYSRPQSMLTPPPTMPWNVTTDESDTSSNSFTRNFREAHELAYTPFSGSLPTKRVRVESNLWLLDEHTDSDFDSPENAPIAMERYLHSIHPSRRAPLPPVEPSPYRLSPYKQRQDLLGGIAELGEPSPRTSKILDEENGELYTQTKGKDAAKKESESRGLRDSGILSWGGSATNSERVLLAGRKT